MLGRFEVSRREIGACAALGTAVALAGLWILHPVAAVLGGYLVFSALLIVLIDARQFLIPDVLSLPAIPLGLVLAALEPEPMLAFANHASAAAGAALLLSLMALFYRRARGFDGLGLGDVKLAAAAGAWTGVTGVPVVLLAASLAAISAVVVRGLLSPSDRASRVTPVPFGSFLAPAIVLVWAVQRAGFY